MKIDGKEVRKFLFSRLSRIAYPGCIPTGDGRRYVVSVCVECFGKDDAITRLEKAYPQVPRGDWEFIDELDPSHDLGKMGTTLKLNPAIMPEHRRLQ